MKSLFECLVKIFGGWHFDRLNIPTSSRLDSLDDFIKYKLKHIENTVCSYSDITTLIVLFVVE